MTKLLAMCVIAAGCRSAPSHYYTLITPPGAESPPTNDELELVVLPVDVPPEVDRAEIVVRRGPGEVTPVETRAWIAPLSLEIRRALSDDLTRVLAVRDMADLTPTAGVPTYRIKLVVQGFESALGDHASIDATWTVREASGNTPALVCSIRATETARGDYEGLAEAHQRALARIAAHIAAGVRGMTANAPSCPATRSLAAR
jgi:uncharacterized lipoprotein YmbA